MNLRLPPHIAWPAFVVALLLTSITAALLTVLAARTDGGAQVIDDYYQQAARWDETMAARAASDALGWQAELDVGPLQEDRRALSVLLRDRAGQPLEGLRVAVRAFRPQRAGAVAEAPLEATDAPGRYHQVLPIGDAGLWDFEVIAIRDTVRFQTRLRRELHDGAAPRPSVD